MKKSNQKSLRGESRDPRRAGTPRPEGLRPPDLGLDDAYKVFILIRFLLHPNQMRRRQSFEAYLRHRTDDVYIVRIQPQLKR